MDTRDNVRKEILDTLPKNPHGRIIAAPRVGKTVIAIDMLKRDRPKSILWVTPSAELAEHGIMDEMAKWKASAIARRTTCVTYASLHKVTGRYDTVILDEEQFVTENNCATLLNGSLEYGNIISMTGTKPKDSVKNAILSALGLKILYELDINSAVDMGMLSNYAIKVLEIPMSFHKDIEVGPDGRKFMTSEINNYRWLDRKAEESLMFGRNAKMAILRRMHAIYDSPSKERAMMRLKSTLEGRNMYFCPTIAMADRVCGHRYHSKTNTDDLHAFIDGDINEISMVNSGTVGFTYKAVDNLVISQVNSDNTGATTQKICRVLLKQPRYDAMIWILCLKDTKDMEWVGKALDNFDPNKIEWLDYGKF